MALPSSGQISLAQIAAEFGGSQPYSLSQFYRGGGRVTDNNTGIPTSGLISLGQFYGASKLIVTPGSANYGVGSRSIVIPAYNTLTIQIWGAGGGGGGMGSLNDEVNTWRGGTGGSSSFTGASISMVAAGGTGAGNNQGAYTPGGAGSVGGASGGNNANTAGGGNAGGAGAVYSDENGTFYGTAGARGGMVKSVFTRGAAGAPAIGATYTLVCGAGGGGGYAPLASGSAGAAASATLIWS